ncbi:hypothetical protein AQUCO_05800003v1 [Aquilegia coerulea]|uniref:Uncharacterized protein n=1 Tax=Aquilegia coerulea TaxID=218851 RepID=A0A2G5CE77_AQUCA|nr:hypothetical protein AQUCO_05800003v1 [Aquilegia coerulea]
MDENAPLDTPVTTINTNRPRYAPPNQRSRPLTRRKSSGDRFDRTSNSSGSGIVPIIIDQVQGEAATTNLLNNDNLLLHPAPGLLTIHGCCHSGAAQLLTNRWVTAIDSYNDPSIDSSERPIMYSGASASAWGHSKLSHQMDFLTELRRAICSANASLGSQ